MSTNIINMAVNTPLSSLALSVCRNPSDVNNLGMMMMMFSQVKSQHVNYKIYSLYAYVKHIEKKGMTKRI
jgi:hypothetical protein